MEVGFVALIVVAVGVIWIFNRLVRGRNYVKDAWAGISVQLTKRHDLIPLLVSVVKQYTNHESSLLTEVTSLRAPESGKNAKATEAEEQSFGDQFVKLIALAESYPDLKADDSFRRLQDQLVEVEDDLESARRYYNGAVRDYRVQLESFPSSLVAQWFRFEQAEYFELRIDSAKNAPSVKL